jgi:orotate phosphoribosyltransferase
MQTVSRTPEQKAAGLTAARILLELKAVNFRPEEPYTLTAGWKSPVYIDCRKIISFPRARRKIIELAVENITRHIGFESIDAVAGGETAGIPYAAWVSDVMGLPMQYVLKKPKGFGRMAQIEGELKEGQRVLLVEDLATDGGSKLNFMNALRDAGAQCEHAFVVFYYGVFPGALKSLEEQGMNLHFLTTWWDVLEVAETDGHFSKDKINEVRAFLHDPISWSSARGGRGADE